MISSFTWLDYSEEERRKMLDVVDVFKGEQNTRDELGIGAIRDSIAELLFPGTGTVQTRARYFLFIPWIYRDLERRQTSSAKIASEARKVETQLIEALARSHRGQGEGVIGIEARAGLKRLPSNIYWLGLGTWNIRLASGSQDQFHRSLDRFYRISNPPARREETDAPVPILPNWHTGIPDPPETFSAQANFTLRRVEADYLRERIMSSVPTSLLAFLVDKGREEDSADFPWLHPQFSQFPAPMAEQLQHARNFSEVIHGAALLYNYMLAEKSGNQDLKHLKKQYEQDLSSWADLMAARETELSRWDRKRFWQIVNADPTIRENSPTWLFVNQWLDYAINPANASRIKSFEPARRLIYLREQSLKAKLARLDNRDALLNWNGAAGTGRLDYRWRQAKTIIADILVGQKGSHA
jgi:hypothetical protein